MSSEQRDNVDKDEAMAAHIAACETASEVEERIRRMNAIGSLVQDMDEVSLSRHLTALYKLIWHNLSMTSVVRPPAGSIVAINETLGLLDLLCMKIPIRTIARVGEIFGHLVSLRMKVDRWNAPSDEEEGGHRQDAESDQVRRSILECVKTIKELDLNHEFEAYQNMTRELMEFNQAHEGRDRLLVIIAEYSQVRLDGGGGGGGDGDACEQATRPEEHRKDENEVNSSQMNSNEENVITTTQSDSAQ